jgi:hypothetical protein
MLDLVRLAKMLILMQDRCTICAERTAGFEIIVEIVLVSAQDKCTVCAERTISTKIILDAPDGTSR